MFCTTCEAITENLKHYKSQLHAINIRRRAQGYTPLTVEELESDSKTDELVLDLDHKHPPTKTTASAPAQTNRSMLLCLFCEQHESVQHYQEHGLDREQITYIQKCQCYLCYERFVSRGLLYRHLESGRHRTSVTDGTSLYLNNGATLYPNRRFFEVQPAPLAHREPRKEHASDPVYEKIMDIKRLNEFKCGLHSSRAFQKKPF